MNNAAQEHTIKVLRRHQKFCQDQTPGEISFLEKKTLQRTKSEFYYTVDVIRRVNRCLLLRDLMDQRFAEEGKALVCNKYQSRDILDINKRKYRKFWYLSRQSSELNQLNSLLKSGGFMVDKQIISIFIQKKVTEFIPAEQAREKIIQKSLRIVSAK